MQLTSRSLTLFLVGCLALFCTACGSNNKGKIVGKWKMLSAPGFDDNTKKMMDAMNIYAYLEFTNDGSLNIGAASTDQKLQEKIGPAFGATKTCKYKLMSGDLVEIYDLPKDMQEKGGGGLFGKKDRARVKVQINGDNMTIIAEDGQLTCSRVK